MKRRIISIWFPRLPSEHRLRGQTLERPVVLALRHGNSEQVHCLTPVAERAGLRRGMTTTEARTLCPDLQVLPADPGRDARFLESLRRWAGLHAPWVVCDGADGLLLDITGAAHLQGGEVPLLELLQDRLRRAGLSPRFGLGDSRGAAWALAHFAQGSPLAIAPPGEGAEVLTPLPIAALRLAPDMVVSLQRLGLRVIGDLHGKPRAPLARRFGSDLLLRLDQALGLVPEPISPARDRPAFEASLVLAEPIGLLSDLTEGLRLLLEQLCATLLAQQHGARSLELRLDRVDKTTLTLPLRLAAPMREAARILPLYARALEGVEAGFGIDRMQLGAPLTQPLPHEQLGTRRSPPLADLLTRIGTRIGLENIHRLVVLESHWPEASHGLHPATLPLEPQRWPQGRKRPLKIFPPEPIVAHGPTPPQSFRWRAMRFTTAHATGPERIAPEWWQDEAQLRDYWRIQTHQGRRLWLFFTPRQPGWQVQGEFA